MVGYQRKPKRLPEAVVLKDCQRVLQDCKRRGWLTYRRISTTGVPRERGGRVFLLPNPMQGMADLMVFLAAPYGLHTLHVEVKGSDGKLSPPQVLWRDELKSLGNLHYYVVQQVQQLEEVLRSYGLAVPQQVAFDK